jgi:hypothetical protein
VLAVVNYYNMILREQLKKEIAHIFESGANEIRIYNLVVSYIENNRIDSLKIKKAVDILEKHNKWRRGDDSIGMINPVTLGKSIDLVVKEMKNRHIIDFSEIEYPYAIKPNNEKCIHPINSLSFHSDSTVSCNLCGMRTVVF